MVVRSFARALPLDSDGHAQHKIVFFSPRVAVDGKGLHEKRAREDLEQVIEGSFLRTSKEARWVNPMEGDSE